MIVADDTGRLNGWVKTSRLVYGRLKLAIIPYCRSAPGNSAKPFVALINGELLWANWKPTFCAPSGIWINGTVVPSLGTVTAFPLGLVIIYTTVTWTWAAVEKSNCTWAWVTVSKFKSLGCFVNRDGHIKGGLGTIEMCRY